MNSKHTSQSLKGGDEPSGVLKVLAFSYIETLKDRGEVEIREVLDDKGNPVDPPVTVVIFSNTSYQNLTDGLGPPESVGSDDSLSVGNDEEEPEPLPTLANTAALSVGNIPESVGAPGSVGNEPPE